MVSPRVSLNDAGGFNQSIIAKRMTTASTTDPLIREIVRRIVNVNHPEG